MFKNLTAYKLVGRDAGLDKEAAAHAAQFQPCGPTQHTSIGFVPPRRPNDAFVENVAGELILCAQIEVKKVPPAEVTKWVDARATAIEQQTGRKPGRKQRAELKDEALLDLLPKAFPKATRVLVWVDRKAGLVALDTASSSAADAATTLLTQSLGMTLGVVSGERSPGALMREWLQGVGPHGFDLGTECELQSPETKETVRYSNARLDRPEIQAHLDAGKQVRSLGLEYAGRASFVLHEDGTLRKVSIDVAPESGAGEDGFDADVMLATGELRPLLADLLAAMGAAS